MSLDYDLRKIKNRADRFPPNTEHTGVLGTLNLKVNAAIWSCIATQIGEITDENADEWFDRYVFWNRLQGHQPDEFPLTRDDVHALVGLKTNVWPHMSRADWLERQFQLVGEGR